MATIRVLDSTQQLQLMDAVARMSIAAQALSGAYVNVAAALGRDEAAEVARIRDELISLRVGYNKEIIRR